MARRLVTLVPVLIALALVLPSAAFGQATRTWVSGVGDDANPCSRTAPCKTFAGAVSKTAQGGEINCLDPGGFGGLTILHSLTIKCQYTEGGVLVSGTNGIVINAAPTDTITLRGLDFNGFPGAAAPSLAGVKVLSAKHVSVMDSEIWGFTAGVDVNPTSSSTTVVVAHSHIHQNGVGVINAPASGAVGFSSVLMRDDDVQNNTCGVANSAFGTNASTPTAGTDCGTAAAGAFNRPAIVDIFHSSISQNSNIGVLSRGSNATTELAYDEVTANTTFGVHRLDTGHFRTFTPATNVIINNGATDAPDQTTPLTKRQPKRRAKRHAKRRYS